MTAAPAPPSERIAKRMARAGLCSRRDAELWIADGRVQVNGKKISSPALNVVESDNVVVDGKPLPGAEKTRLWRYHKPRGLLTTARDDRGRPTVMDFMPPELPRVITVGRLDFNSEGLLLLTNDGELAKYMADPKTAWLRRYRVRAHGTLPEGALARMTRGITVEGIHYGPMEVQIEKQQGGNLWLQMGLREGKNREIRRVLAHLGLEVNRLIRVSFGAFMLGDLPIGAAQEVTGKVLKEQCAVFFKNNTKLARGG